jgi:hypothetical protein
MEERTKYVFMGVMIGIAIGIAISYLLLNFGIIRPFGFRELMRPENLTNFTRNFSRGMV